MGDKAFCCFCSPFEEQNETLENFMQKKLLNPESMENVGEIIDYIERVVSNIGRVEPEHISLPASVYPFVNFGRALTKFFSKPLKWHVGKKRLLSALDSRTTKIVADVLNNQAQHIPYAGMVFSIVAYLMEQTQQVCSNNDIIINLLKHMSVLAKHTRNLNIQLQQEKRKLEDILRFIVKATVLCELQKKRNCCRRFMSAAVDNDDLQDLQRQLVVNYQDLECQALTALLARVPLHPGPSQGEYLQDAVDIKEEVTQVIELLNLTDESSRVVVIYGIGGIGKTTLATAVFNQLDLTGYNHCRVEMDQDATHRDLKDMQKKILRDLSSQNWELSDCTEGRRKLCEAFGKATKPVFLFIDNALKKSDLEMLLPIEHLSLPVRSRILVTTRNLNEAKLSGIQVYSHKVDFLSKQESKSLLCHYALGDVSGSFAPGVNMDGLLKICGGMPLVLRIVGSHLGSHLRTLGNTVSAYNEIVEHYREWQQEGLVGGAERPSQRISERIVEFAYRQLRKPSQEAFLDIAFFFLDWEASQVGRIVGELELRQLEEAALVTTSEEDEWDMDEFWPYKMVKSRKVVVKMHDIVIALGRKLSEGNRIVGRESFHHLLGGEQKLQRTKGIWLDDEDFTSILRKPGISLEAKHVELIFTSLIPWKARENKWTMRECFGRSKVPSHLPR